MARALQSASLSFGLVTIPVKLYTAAKSKSVAFHWLHQRTAVEFKSISTVRFTRRKSHAMKL